MVAYKADPRLWPWFWTIAVEYTNYLAISKNGLPVLKSRKETFFDENQPGKDHKVDLSYLRIPGSKVLVYIP